MYLVTLKDALRGGLVNIMDVKSMRVANTHDN